MSSIQQGVVALRHTDDEGVAEVIAAVRALVHDSTDWAGAVTPHVEVLVRHGIVDDQRPVTHVFTVKVVAEVEVCVTTSAAFAVDEIAETIHERMVREVGRVDTEAAVMRAARQVQIAEGDATFTWGGTEVDIDY